MGRMRTRDFAQVDVFTAEPYLGNPVAVVLDAEGLTDDEMAAFARWTNLSETTFVLPPTDPAADYRLRVFTPGGELPFAGHPTIGSAHAWLEAGGTPRDPAAVVQECAVGLVRLRRAEGRLAFAAPPLRRTGPVEPEVRAQALRALGVTEDDVRDVAWLDNGPPWVGVLLHDAEAVLAVVPDPAALGDLMVGVIGLHDEAGRSRTGAHAEVRAFAGGIGVVEDPVTGSLNAGVGQWLAAAGVLPDRYVVSQGTALRRAGRVHVERVGDEVWVGGDAVTGISGTVLL
jgi:PhzF family phenazine biosynthesis protein